MTQQSRYAAEKGRNAPGRYLSTEGDVGGTTSALNRTGDNERFCRCGCGEMLTGRPEKVYSNRIHKDRVHNRKRREQHAVMARLRDHRPAWEAIGKLMGWL